VRLVDVASPVTQLHWGGGTPTFLAAHEMTMLWRLLRDNFTFAPNAECSIEIDPRKLDTSTIALLSELGFNRMSLGVQDFDPEVQKAVNRIQSEGDTPRLDAARVNGFRSLNVDLIYGLPRQTVAGFAATLDKTIDAAPDRIALYSYAHVPHLFKPQRRISEADLPSPDAKLAILRLAIEKLTGAGYLYIGMDHFARSDDELAIAQRDGKLQRNFRAIRHRPTAIFSHSVFRQSGKSARPTVRTCALSIAITSASMPTLYRVFAAGSSRPTICCGAT
jgi:oxygen-independent coproporphyrinogen-3 oxidase